MECAICYDGISTATGKVELSCSHSFHFSCLTHWFKTQAHNELEESCPCCRHESNEYEKMPNTAVVADEDEDEDEDEEVEELSEQESIDLAAAKERAAFRIAKLKKDLSKEAFEDYASSKISALFRGYCARYKVNEIKDIKANIMEETFTIIKTKQAQRFDKKALVFTMKSLTMSHTAWRNHSSSIIQKWWRMKWHVLKTSIVVVPRVSLRQHSTLALLPPLPLLPLLPLNLASTEI